MNIYIYIYVLCIYRFIILISIYAYIIGGIPNSSMLWTTCFSAYGLISIDNSLLLLQVTMLPKAYNDTTTS